MTYTPGLAGLSTDKPLISPTGSILLLGATGQIGAQIKPILESLYPGKVISTSRKASPHEGIQALDFTHTDEVVQLIKDKNVEVVVNMAALLSGGSEVSPDQAREVNYEAVKRLIERTPETKVKMLFTPSSIAAYGPDAERCATLESPTHPSGVYGQAKVDLENFMREWNEKGQGAFCSSMRLGGVLTCKMPPSAGTAMEFDKMIVAAATELATRKPSPELTEYYSPEGRYHPQIPADTKMPFIFIDDAAREIVRYIHNIGRNDPNATRHHLASFTMDMKEFCSHLDAITRHGFKYDFDTPSETGPKAQFSREWPDSLDMSDSKSWGFNKALCSDARQAIYKCFKRVVDAQKGLGAAISHG